MMVSAVVFGQTTKPVAPVAVTRLAEPSAIPEFAVALLGVGALVLLQRRQARQ
jgi:MYXO-CTERM domain-containing protein